MTPLPDQPIRPCCGVRHLLALALFAALAALAGSLTPARSDDEKKDEKKPDEKQISKWIDQLGDDDEQVRKKAEESLLKLGEAALAPLQKATKDHPDADVRLRAIIIAKAVARGAYRELKKLTGHTNWIRSIAVSKDGKRALTGSQDRTMRLWDLEKGTLIKQFDMTKQADDKNWTWQVVFSPDEKYALTSGGVDGTLRLFDVEKGTEVRRYPFPKPNNDNPKWVYAAAFSPDGKYVLGGEAGPSKKEEDTSYELRLFDTESGKELRTFKGHTGYIWRACFSPDGKKIASVGANDRTYRIWDTETAKCLVTGKEAHEDNVVGLAWTPDSKQVLTSGRDQTCKLWDAESGKLVRTFKDFPDDIEAVAFSKDGKRFLAGGEKVVHVVDVDSTKIVHRFEEHTGPILAVAFLPNGTRGLSGGKDNTVRLWSIPK